MQTLAQFSTHLAGLIPAVGGGEFADRLVAMLKQLVSCEDATVILYPGTDLPQIEYFEVPPGATRSTLDVYVRGAFLLDPYYLAATRDKSFGVFRLGDLAPRDFRNSDYYKTWYRNCGYRDECGYLVALGPEGFVNIALGKLEARSRFSARELETLEAIRMCQAVREAG